MNVLHLVFAVCAASHSYNHIDVSILQTGDFIFQDLDCGELCDAIEQVTTDHGQLPWSHVAVVLETNHINPLLIEAYGSVKITPYNEFITRSHDAPGVPKIMVARLQKPWRQYIPAFIAQLKKRLGKPYDNYFLPYNNAYYCSELITESFASLDLVPFPLVPMSFGLSGSHAYQIWSQEFKKLGKPLPDKVLGSNPRLLLQYKKVLQVISN